MTIYMAAAGDIIGGVLFCVVFQLVLWMDLGLNRDSSKEFSYLVVIWA